MQLNVQLTLIDDIKYKNKYNIKNYICAKETKEHESRFDLHYTQ